MGIIDSLFRRFGYVKAPQPKYPTWALEGAGVERWDVDNSAVPAMWGAQADLYRRLSWIAMAVERLAVACAAQNAGVKRLEGEDLTDVKNHDFERLLSNPNPLQSRFEFLRDSISYRAVTGNAFWWINTPSEDAPPVEMWCIPTDRIRPVPDEQMFLRGYLYDPGDGQEIPLEPWEVVHFRRWNPRSMFVGLSPVEAIYMQAKGDLNRLEWETKLYGEENGRLPGILAFADPIGDVEWNRLQREARNKANKREMMMLRGAGTGGVHWIQTTMSNTDMQFLEQREFTKEEIFGLFAPGLSSMLAVNATEANAKSGKATFSEYAMWPMLDEIGQKITKTLMPRYGENLVCVFDDPRMKDRAMELQEIAEYSKTHTIEEVRQKYYNDDPLGDERDKLLVVQIKAESGGIQKPPEPPIQLQQAPAQGKQPPEDEGEPEQRAEADPMEGEMMKWQRKAIKRLREGQGAGVKFESTHISPSTAGAITGALEACKTEAEVKRVFRSVRPWKAYP